MYMFYDLSFYVIVYWGVCIVWGLVVMFLIYVIGVVLGMYGNLVVMLVLVVFCGFFKCKVLLYVVVQIIGVFIGVVFVYQMFLFVIDVFNMLYQVGCEVGGVVGVFFMYFGVGIMLIYVFWDEVILIGILMFGIFVIIDEYNMLVLMVNLSVLMIGLLVVCIGVLVGYLEVWLLNFVCDFGLWLFCYLMGWGDQVFFVLQNYWWVLICGLLFGGIVGVSVYGFLIKLYLLLCFMC